MDCMGYGDGFRAPGHLEDSAERKQGECGKTQHHFPSLSLSLSLFLSLSLCHYSRLKRIRLRGHCRTVQNDKKPLVAAPL